MKALKQCHSTRSRETNSVCFSPRRLATPSVCPGSAYLQVAVPSCVYYGPFQLESINKRNQRSQTRKLNALINLCHLHKKHKVNNNSYHLFSQLLSGVSWNSKKLEKLAYFSKKRNGSSEYVNNALLELELKSKANEKITLYFKPSHNPFES